MNRRGLHLQHRPSVAPSLVVRRDPAVMQQLLTAAEESQRMADYWRKRAAHAEAQLAGRR